MDNEHPTANNVENLVERLLASFHGKGHTLKMDRYLCATGIASKLHHKGINALGTCRNDRKELPLALKQKKLKKGEHVSYRSGVVLAVKWKSHVPLFIKTTWLNQAPEESIRK